MLVDSHCHLQSEAFAADLEAVLERARAAGVARMVSIGWSIASSEAALRLAERHEAIYATAGIAPHDETRYGAATRDALRALAAHPRCVAIGECGLDFHYNTWDRRTQTAVFADQLELAAELDKPVVVHSRDAADATLAALERHGRNAGERPAGVMHCYSDDAARARTFAALGFLISIAGPVTYPKPRALPDVVRALPLDALVVETDAPFLAPQPWRGKRNEPAYVVETARAVARLRGEPYEAVAAALGRNAERLYGLPR